MMASSRELGHVLASARRAVDELRSELRREFGWTHLEIGVQGSAEQQAIVLSGTVVVSRVARRLVAAVLEALPDGWRVDPTAVLPLRTGAWHGLVEGTTPVWQRLAPAGRVLSTELLPEDGAVELLASSGGWSLVRAMDATVGWVEQPLGARTEPPCIAPAHGSADGVVEAARAFLTAPYQLGGATQAGLDCSALVQRAYARGLGVRLPRHSTDQLVATLGWHESPRQSADLAFAWTETEGPCHVGIVADEGRSVVHASLSRRAVVEDPIERFFGDASRTELVALASVLEFHRTNVGSPALELSDQEDSLERPSASSPME